MKTKINIQNLRKLSAEANQKKENKNKKAVAKRNLEERLKNKNIAEGIISMLKEDLENAAKNGENSIVIAETEVSGKRDEYGWLVDFKDCDAEEDSEKYLHGYLKIIYRHCKKMGLQASFHHDHRGEDSTTCWLGIVISW